MRVRRRAWPVPPSARALAVGLLRGRWAQPQQISDVAPQRARRPLSRWCALRTLLWLGNRLALPLVMASRKNPTLEFQVRRAQLAWSVAESPRVGTLCSAPRGRGGVPRLVLRIPADSAATQLLPCLNLLEVSRIHGSLRHPEAWLGHELLPLEAMPPAVQANVATVLLGVGVQDVVVAAVPTSLSLRTTMASIVPKPRPPSRTA